MLGGNLFQKPPNRRIPLLSQCLGLGDTCVPNPITNKVNKITSIILD